MSQNEAQADQNIPKMNQNNPKINSNCIKSKYSQKDQNWSNDSKMYQQLDLNGSKWWIKS